MADIIQFKEKIRKILAQDYVLEFLGPDFDWIVSCLNESQESRIIQWVQNVFNNKEKIIRNPASAITYKSWKVKDILLFRYAFNISNI